MDIQRLCPVFLNVLRRNNYVAFVTSTVSVSVILLSERFYVISKCEQALVCEIGDARRHEI